MLSIGEFSKICEVSTKTLRYYDEIGLLTPAEINPENGYRSYAIGQLKRMLFINRLKAYQFSLEEIKAVLSHEPDQADDQLAAALNRKKLEIGSKLDAFSRLLQQMDADLAAIRNGVSMMAYLDQIEVQLVETAPMNLLSIRCMMSSEDFAGGYQRYFGSMVQRIMAKKLSVVGPPMTLYHSAEYDPAGNDTEFAIPVMQTGEGIRKFSGGLCAKSVLHGDYTGLTSVYARLREWMESGGYTVRDSPYEVYLSDPQQVRSPDELITEVYFPVNKP